MIRTISNRTNRASMYERPAKISHSMGVYTPLKTQKPDESIDIIAAIDVSASVSQNELEEF